MNQLTSQHRKLVYLAGIVLLLLPIILLGAPPAGNPGGVASEGGKLSQLRRRYDLGESTLGDVDPTSATMNLVLLGLRGVATNLLWLEADHLKETKSWAELRTTVDSIIKLQPHYKEVWRFQGWNLSYNVSVEWDAVEDRYYWVKEGGKFLVRGTRRNNEYPELFWDVGRVTGPKIGRSDEKKQFRQFFREEAAGNPVDPESAERETIKLTRRGGRPDGEVFRDNYLAAKDWFTQANRVEEQPGVDQDMMMRVLFRSYPARAQFDYAQALQREGNFGEETRLAWAGAFEDWTREFGQEIFFHPRAERLKLEATDEDVRRLADDDGVPVADKRDAINSYRDVTNYEYWRSRAKAESEERTIEAHREIYEGQRLYRKGFVNTSLFFPLQDTCERIEELDVTDAQRKLLQQACQVDYVWYQEDAASTASSRQDLEHTAELLGQVANVVTVDELARRLDVKPDALLDDLYQLRASTHVDAVSEAHVLLESGMRKFADFLDAYPDFDHDVNTVEEALLAVVYFRKLHELNERSLPTDYPLADVWDAEQGKELGGRTAEAERAYRRQIEGD